SLVINSDTTAGLDSFCYVICESLNGNQSCDTAMVYVSVKPLPKFFIPQGFSPNGDNVNDVLVIPATNKFPNSYLIVYNRYGDEVWRGGPNYGNNFSGTAPNGHELPDGTYFYIYQFNDGVQKDIQGYVIINR
ncbi:MAG TPA: gliding motility-associated C-terminal domain-containing protein, partial [Chitinophagales bacterium]